MTEIAPGTFRLPLDFPNGSVPFTLCYLFVDEHDRVHLLDPGADTIANRDRVTAAIAELAGPGRSEGPDSVTITHSHHDHLGLARHLQAHGVPLIAHPAEARARGGFAVDRSELRSRYSAVLVRWGVPRQLRAQLLEYIDQLKDEPFDVDIPVADGDLLPIPGRRLQVIHTPGHTPGHICLRDLDAACLFTGDHVLPDMYPGIGIGGTTESNPMLDYFTSLERVALFDDHEVHPGHQRSFRGIRQRTDDIAAHHRRRARHVRDLAAAQPDGTVWQIAVQLRWSGGWDNLRGFALHSALMQTEQHLKGIEPKASTSS